QTLPPLLLQAWGMTCDTSLRGPGMRVLKSRLASVVAVSSGERLASAPRYRGVGERAKAAIKASARSLKGIRVKRDTMGYQHVMVIACFRCRGRGKAAMFDNTVAKRSGNVRWTKRAAGVVASAARQSKLCSTVHTLYRRFGKPRGL